MRPHREAITDFLLSYKCLPCLWDQTDKMYTHKHAREQAYEILMEKFKVIEGPDATVESMKKKIDNMRCTYRREFKKVQESKQKGQEEYFPRLWYYDHLSFLHENSDLSQSNLKKSSSCSNNSQLDDEDYQSNSPQMSDEEPLSKKFKQESVYFQENDDNEDPPRSTQQENFTKEDISEPDAFGRAVGLQLKGIEPLQRTIAEKLISEIIFYGRLNKLNLETSVYLNEELE